MIPLLAQMIASLATYVVYMAAYSTVNTVKQHMVLTTTVMSVPQLSDATSRKEINIFGV